MAHPLPDDSPVGLPRRPVHRLAEPLLRFMRIESASGIVLIAATVGALVAANSDVADAFQSFWNQTVSVGVSGFELSYPLWYWINDALMTIFFFVVGLEIKRELAVGELSEPRKVVLPVVAAAGGAVVPVLLFLGLQHGEPGAKAWAVPMATDIAFVVGALALLGPRIPHGLKVLMLTLAIVDDIMAVVVIAVFFTGSIHLVWSAGAIAGLLLTAGLRRLGVRRVSVYAVVGAFVWLCALKSGVHPTVAGVALGLCLVYALVLVGNLTFFWATAIFVASFVAVFGGAGGQGGRALLLRLAAAAGFGLASSGLIAVLFRYAFLVRLP